MIIWWYSGGFKYVETFRIWILNGNEGLELKFINAHQLNQRQLHLQLKEKNITMLSCKSCEFFPVLLCKSFRCQVFQVLVFHFPSIFPHFPSIFPHFPTFSQHFPSIFPSLHHFPSACSVAAIFQVKNSQGDEALLEVPVLGFHMGSRGKFHRDLTTTQAWNHG